MNILKTLKNEAQKIVVKQAVGKILPMDGEKPKLGTKAKLAAIFTAIAALATAASQYLGG